MVIGSGPQAVGCVRGSPASLLLCPPYQQAPWHCCIVSLLSPVFRVTAVSFSMSPALKDINMPFSCPLQPSPTPQSSLASASSGQSPHMAQVSAHPHTHILGASMENPASEPAVHLPGRTWGQPVHPRGPWLSHLQDEPPSQLCPMGQMCMGQTGLWLGRGLDAAHPLPAPHSLNLGRE